MNVNSKDATAIKGDLRILTGDLKLVRDDLTVMKGDLTVMNGELTVMKGELSIMKGDLTFVRTDLKKFQHEITRKLALETVKTHARIDMQIESLRGEIRAMSSTQTKQFDGFMSEAGKIDRAQIIADWRVAQLEKRVDKIESRPS